VNFEFYVVHTPTNAHLLTLLKVLIYIKMHSTSADMLPHHQIYDYTTT